MNACRIFALNAEFWIPPFLLDTINILDVGLRKRLCTCTIRFRNDSHTQTHREII